MDASKLSVEEIADVLEASEGFERIIDNGTPQQASDLRIELVRRGWQEVEPGSYCSVALQHHAVRKDGITLDIIASELFGPFISATRYSYG